MKINKPKNKKTIIILGLSTIILIGAAYAGAAFMYKWYPFQVSPQPIEEQVNNVNYEEATKEQQNAPTEMTEEGSKNQPQDSTQDTITVAITSSQVDPSGALRIGTIIQTLVSSGECTLSVKKGNQEVDLQKADVQALSNSSTCKGFTVPAIKLTSGTYTLTVSYAGDKGKGSAQTEVAVP
jgi:hypothetical protein